VIKMKNYLVCVITLFALLVGCTSKTLHKDGASQGDYKRDKLACEKKLIRLDMDMMFSIYV
jgi:major membrane immunogen (membrane-anchored lipoprotein)